MYIRDQSQVRLFTLYKCYQNMIVNLLRRCKQNYYSLFFLQNQSNIKKTWDGIWNVINVSKKKNSTPTKLIYKNQEKVSNVEIAESLNDFFVNIGSNMWNLKSPNQRIISSKYGLKSFKYQGIKILNDLKNTSIYQTATSKSKFVWELKSNLLSSYIAWYKDALTFSHQYY